MKYGIFRNLNMAHKFCLSKTKILLTAGIVLGFWMPFAVSAITFDPNNIISDAEFFNYNSLAQKDISYFLQQKGSYLANYSTDANGTLKSAAQIIYDAALEYRINPRVILVTLQKEQSLITKTNPSQTSLDYAMGYGCPDGGSCNPSTAGFFKQVDYAIWQFRRYTDVPNSFTYRVGNTYTLSSQSVTIANQATANLYNYTPHIYNGNYNFWNLYNSWFTIRYPDGSLLNPAGEPGIWLIKDGLKFPFHSKAAFLSRYDIRKVITVPAGVLDAYPLGTPIKYPDLSLLMAPSGGIYLILDGTRYAITSKQVFNELGFNIEEVRKVSWDELNVYPDGAKISTLNQTPSGRLLQSKQTGAIYLVENDVRRTIYSKEILRSRYPFLKWVAVEQSVLDQLTKGEAVKFNDGELITSPNSNGVYLISNGYKRGIPSQQVFNGMGYKWSNIVKTTDQALQAHPTGEPITLFSL